MGLGATAKMMTLHHALKTFSLAHAHDVDKLLAFENVDQHAISSLHSTLAVAVSFERHFAHKLNWRKVVLCQMALRRLGQPRLLHKLHQANLRRFVTVFDGRLVLRHHTRTSLQHCDRAHIALRVEQLRHADLLAQNARNSDRHLSSPPSLARRLLAPAIGCEAILPD